MREIKFRGKIFNGNEFTYGSLSMGGLSITEKYDKKRTYIEPVSEVLTRIKVHPETVGQYTGLKDKNGKEIYEGDIVRFIGDGYLDTGNFCFDDEWSFTGKVEFFDTFFAVFDKTGNGAICLSHFFDDSVVYIEILGNIHENQELLRGGNE